MCGTDFQRFLQMFQFWMRVWSVYYWCWGKFKFYLYCLWLYPWVWIRIFHHSWGSEYHRPCLLCTQENSSRGWWFVVFSWRQLQVMSPLKLFTPWPWKQIQELLSFWYNPVIGLKCFIMGYSMICWVPGVYGCTWHHNVLKLTLNLFNLGTFGVAHGVACRLWRNRMI